MIQKAKKENKPSHCSAFRGRDLEFSCLRTNGKMVTYAYHYTACPPSLAIAPAGSCTASVWVPPCLLPGVPQAML